MIRTPRRFWNYDVHDGLQSNEFNGGAYYRSPDGKLFFGGINGYNAFYPQQIVDNQYRPTVVVTGFMLSHQPVDVGQEHEGRILLDRAITETSSLTLSYQDYVFSFDFAALDFVNSAKNQYAYWMEGLEPGWNYVGNRNFVTYTAVPPGDYTFRVKASNNQEVWNEQGAAIAITVTPPFWQTWWFNLFGLGILGLIGSLIYGWRMKLIRSQQHMLEHKVEVRTAQLEEQKKNLENTLVELGQTKDTLIETAHKAGMADTATGVLHNIGNILNSINTSTSLINESLAKPVSLRFGKATAMLRDNLENLEQFMVTPKGRKLLEYLLELEQPFERENTQLKENAHRVREMTGAIKDVIAAQQSQAKGQENDELLCLQDLVEQCLMLEVSALDRHNIRLEKRYVEVPPVRVQKTKVAQIIMNLIKNGKEAILEADQYYKKLKVEIFRRGPSVCVSITDSGRGVEVDDLDKLFTFGFTTKSDGHGFGLHSCANYMTEMGGEISVRNSGPGLGASFVLHFPLAAEDCGNAPTENEVAIAC